MRGAAAYMIPGSLGIDEDVHLDLYAGIAINAAERDPMYGSVACPAERGATTAAKAQAPPWRSLEVSEIVLAIGPRERAESNFRIGRPGTAERSSAARTMTTSARSERRGDLVANTPAKATAS